ncbi:hypothetical protein VTJ49DRAFT_1432 [Mycothermus thermophilus]|uniref:Uncharacterized protein n=1 Tax=Humicola insolens TaxID=85995 RepID=A0ABR3VD23_HUMIN
MAAVAPMELVVGGDVGPIPLRCTICPKKPNFSDLSHLLTHISSKSHLAHRFKAELKARTDRAALEEVRQYDSWCERYGINGLLAERLAAKEKKKSGRRGRPANADNRSNVAAGIHTCVKTEPDDYQALGHWPPIPGHYHHGHPEPFDTPGYPTPNLKRSRSDQSDPTTPENEPRPKFYRRWPSETATTDSVIPSDLPSEAAEVDEDNDSSKLKGVKYPGMGLFDSADETQRRMRNQRKDESVLRQMEEASSGIAPNEFVWTEDGEFQRIRDIYATPSVEGTPDRDLEDEEEEKPKRGRRSTAAASKPVRTRTSTRTTRQTIKTKRGRQDDGGDAILESADGYDIFRDPPKATRTRIDSPQQAHGYELRRRPALQAVNKNMPIGSAPQKQTKPMSYMTSRETAATPMFSSQPPMSGAHYFHPQQTMGPGTFNPLCVQARGAYYNPYGYSNFSNDTKPSPPTFQAMNAMNLGNLPYNSFNGPFASDTAHETVDHDYDI